MLEEATSVVGQHLEWKEVLTRIIAELRLESTADLPQLCRRFAPGSDWDILTGGTSTKLGEEIFTTVMLIISAEADNKAINTTGPELLRDWIRSLKPSWNWNDWA